MIRLTRPKALATTPRVSVVIPCYNYRRYLADAVRSATIEQPGVDVDVLVVDDCSPDGSAELARELASADPRVSVLQHEANAGHLRTYNDGLRAVTGEYVVLLSADDLLAPGALARAVAVMEAEPSVGLVYGLPKRFSGRPPHASSRVHSWSVFNGREWYRMWAKRGRNPILSPEAVMRRDLLVEIGYYDLNMPHTADLFAWMQAAQRADVGRVNGPYQAYYRMHEQQMHWTDFRHRADDARERLKTWDRLISDDPAGEADGSPLAAAVREALARESVDFASAAIDTRRADFPVDDMATFAVELWPPITATVAWRLLDLRRGRQGPPVWSPAARLWRTYRKGMRWLRWREFGA